MSRGNDDQAGRTVDPGEREEERELDRIDREYRVTLQVLAVLTERYLQASGQAMVIISDTDLANQPDFIAHRDETRKLISLTVTR